MLPDISSKEILPIVIMYAIVFIIIASIIIIYKIPEIREKEELAKQEREEWIQEYVDNGIHSFAIVSDNYLKEIPSERGSHFARVKRFYINNELSDPSSLLHYEHFFIERCGKWYFTYIPITYNYQGLDSLVYMFKQYGTKRDIYNKHNQFIKKSEIFSQKNFLLKYKDILPQCEDEN